MIIDELQSGLGKFKELQNIITENDVKFKSVEVAREILEFLEKVERKISNEKRIDLYCFDQNNPKQLLKPSEVKEGYEVVGLFERGMGKRRYKRTHSYKLSMLQTYNDDEAKKMIEILTNPQNNWIINSIKDNSTKETLQKFILFIQKYHNLLMNLHRRSINLKLIKEVSLPIKLLKRNHNYENDKYEIQETEIKEISFDTEREQNLSFEYKAIPDYDHKNISLADYSQHYIIQQHYDEFKNILLEFKQQIADEIGKIDILHKELKQDTDKLKSELTHIFVADVL